MRNVAFVPHLSHRWHQKKILCRPVIERKHSLVFKCTKGSERTTYRHWKECEPILESITKIINSFNPAVETHLLIHFICRHFAGSNVLMLLWSIVADLFSFAACFFFLTVKWNADLNSAEDFLVSLPSGCRLSIVLCVWVSCLNNCMRVYQAPVPLACHAYSMKLRFVQKSSIRSLVTCWRCFLFNTPGFYPCQCQKRERSLFSQPHARTSTQHCTCIKIHGTLH